MSLIRVIGVICKERGRLIPSPQQKRRSSERTILKVLFSYVPSNLVSDSPLKSLKARGFVSSLLDALEWQDEEEARCTFRVGHNKDLCIMPIGQINISQKRVSYGSSWKG